MSGLQLFFEKLKREGEITPPTESEILAYIMANFPPDLFIDPEQGIVDSSGNGVAISTAGSPTLHASGGPNDRGYIELDGVDDVIISDRVDIGTQCIILRQGAVNNQMILNVPTSNTGSGDGPKFFKQGIVCRTSAPTVFQFYPDSGGTKLSIRGETGHVAGTWQTLLHRGDDYAYKNGQHFGSATVTAVADTTVTKMFFGAWGYGNGTNINNFNEYDLALYMSWNNELTNDQMYIVNAYLELRSGTYGNKTYLYRANDVVEIEASNPVFNGNSFSGPPDTQSYAGSIVPGIDTAYFKGQGAPQIFAFNNPDSNYLNWTDQDGVMELGGFGEFDEGSINAGYLFVEDDLIKFIYCGRNLAGTAFQIGYAYKDVSDPLGMFTKYGSNPIIELADVNTPLGTPFDFLYPLQVWKTETGYTILLQCFDNPSGTFGAIVKMTGTTLFDFANPEIILTNSDSPIKYYNASHTAFADPLGYMSLPTVGQSRGVDAGGFHIKQNKMLGLVTMQRVFYDDLINQGSMIIFPVIGDADGTNFKVVCDPIIECGAVNTWNTSQVYLPSLLIKQEGNYTEPYLVNGKYLVYFSGLGRTVDGINTKGQVGYAYMSNKTYIKNLLP